MAVRVGQDLTDHTHLCVRTCLCGNATGGSVGLMGVVARTVQEKLGDGSVLGVMPEALIPREITGDHIGELKIVPDMHTRKVCGGGVVHEKM